MRTTDEKDETAKTKCGKLLLESPPEIAPANKESVDDRLVQNDRSTKLRDLIKQIPTYEVKEGTVIGSGYLIDKIIGSGTCSKVYLATKDNKDYAIKVKKHTSKQQKNDNLFERLIMKKISDNHALDLLVGALGTVQYGPNFCYIMEKLDISLYDYQMMNEQRPFQVEAVVSIAEQLCKAVTTLADIGFLHLDIKPSNILFCDIRDTQKRWKIKLCDFGLSLPTQMITSYFGAVQAVNYRSPEVLIGLPKCDKVDSWSVGCVIFSLYTGFELFTAVDELEMLRQIELVTGLPDGFESGVFTQKYFDRSMILRKTSNNVVCKMNYTNKGFDDLEKIGDNYLSTGSFTDLDSTIVRMVGLLLQPTTSKRLNSTQARIL